MVKVVLIGAGGHARVVMDCLDGKAYGFIDDSVGDFYNLEKLEDVKKHHAIIGFGAVTTNDLERRHKVFKNYEKDGVLFITAIHRKAIVSPESFIGEGTVVAPGAIVNAGAKIGKNVIINSGAVIEHDVIIRDGAHIAPRAVILGGAIIGECSMIGAGAVVLPKVEVADKKLVKALALKQ